MPWRDIDWKEIGAAGAIAVILWRVLSWALFPRWVATVRLAIAPELAQLATAVATVNRVEESAKALERIATTTATLAERVGHMETFLQATSDFEPRPAVTAPFYRARTTEPL